MEKGNVDGRALCSSARKSGREREREKVKHR